MNASDWITLGGVITAIAAVLVALLQDDLRRWRWTPVLEIEESASLAKIQVATEQYDPWAYIRLRIGVKAGRTAARQVQVHLVTCKPAPTLGGQERMPDMEFLIPLRWSFDHMTTAEIPAGGARYLDVLEVRRDPVSNATQAFLTTKPAPPEGYQLAASTEPYELCVQVMGDNISPVRRRFQILHTGSWDGNMEGLTGHIEARARDEPRAS
jgi:hypothetical protein